MATAREHQLATRLKDMAEALAMSLKTAVALSGNQNDGTTAILLMDILNRTDRAQELADAILAEPVGD